MSARSVLRPSSRRGEATHCRHWRASGKYAAYHHSSPTHPPSPHLTPPPTLLQATDAPPVRGRVVGHPPAERVSCALGRKCLRGSLALACLVCFIQAGRTAVVVAAGRAGAARAFLNLALESSHWYKCAQQALAEERRQGLHGCM